MHKLIADLLRALGLIEQLRMNDDNRIKLYEAAVEALNEDASPKDEAPDELACADSWNEIYKNAFGEYFYSGNRLSTYYLRKALRESSLFKQVYIAAPGDTIISPTGFGTRKNPDGTLVIANGHVGVFMFGGDIASNDSRSQYRGLWRINYDQDSWADRWVRRGGYPLEIYRRV
jgi:hypothetical protein